MSHGYGVRIHPQHLDSREQLMQFLLYPLGTKADMLQCAAALRAHRRRSV